VAPHAERTKEEIRLKVHKSDSTNSRRSWNSQIVPAERWLASILDRPLAAGALCALILCSFAIAGLWPFRQIHNQVTWLGKQPGVHYGGHGIMLSAGALPAAGSGACSIEIWVRPAGGEDFSTLLAFHGPSGNTGWWLSRSITDLRLEREAGGWKPIRYYVPEVLKDGRLVFLTVVSSERGTAVYLDGTLVRSIAPLRAAAGDCSGRFGVGHPATGDSSWQGDILGLAIYQQELTPSQVQMNYQSWRAVGGPDERRSGRPDALYLFNERAGSVVRDQGAAGLNLTIPNLYQNVQPTWLQSPQRAFEWHGGYVEDIVINIGGFVPFGFALSALLASTGRVRSAGRWAILGGFCVSLAIEVLQGYLPTRNSDLTDVLTNTLGACLGAVAYTLWQRRLTRSGEAAVAAGGTAGGR
jgi:VanZ family protein